MTKIIKNGIQFSGSNASEIIFNATQTDLESTNVQGAIVEVNDKIPTIPSSYDADDIVYNNTTSGLAATDAQGAIDEIVAEIEVLKGAGFRNTLLNIQSVEYTSSSLSPT